MVSWKESIKLNMIGGYIDGYSQSFGITCNLRAENSKNDMALVFAIMHKLKQKTKQKLFFSVHSFFIFFFYVRSVN